MSSVIRSVLKPKKKESSSSSFDDLLEKTKEKPLLHKTVEELKKNYEDIVRVDTCLQYINQDLYGDPENPNDIGRLDRMELRLKQIETTLHIKNSTSLKEKVVETSLGAEDLLRSTTEVYDGLPTSEICNLIRGIVQDKIGYLMESHLRQHEDLKSMIGASSPSSTFSSSMTPSPATKQKKGKWNNKKKKRKDQNVDNNVSSSSSGTSINSEGPMDSSSTSSLGSNNSQVKNAAAAFKKKEAEEVRFNLKHKNKIILKIDAPMTEGMAPMQIVLEKLRVLDPSCNVSALANMILYANFLKPDNKSSILITLIPERREAFCEFIRVNRDKEFNFRFMGFIHPLTRAKKLILGSISKSLCQNDPKRACTPRFVMKSKMVVKRNGDNNNKTKTLDYWTVLHNEEYREHLADTDVEAALKICNNKTILLL